MAAGAFGFLIFSQAFDGPDLYGALSFFEFLQDKSSPDYESIVFSGEPLFDFRGGPLFLRLVFIWCPLAFDFSFFRFSLFRHLVSLACDGRVLWAQRLVVSLWPRLSPGTSITLMSDGCISLNIGHSFGGN